MTPITTNLQELKKKYLISLSSETVIDLNKSVRAATDLLALSENHVLAWYYINTALAWWGRRSIDGADLHFFQLIEETIKVCNPNVLNENTQ